MPQKTPITDAEIAATSLSLARITDLPLPGIDPPGAIERQLTAHCGIACEVLLHEDADTLAVEHNGKMNIFDLPGEGVEAAAAWIQALHYIAETDQTPRLRTRRLFREPSAEDARTAQSELRNGIISLEEARSYLFDLDRGLRTAFSKGDMFCHLPYRMIMTELERNPKYSLVGDDGSEVCKAQITEAKFNRGLATCRLTFSRVW